MHNELDKLNSILSSIKNIYYKNLIKQLILLTKAIILYKNEKDYKTSLNTLLKAIKITTPTFTLENYTLFVYSSMEIRILMNIAFSLNKLGYNKPYEEIMIFCIQSVDSYDVLYPKICHNLAGVYKRNNNDTKSLKYANMGIKACQENRDLNGLNLLYYAKGIAEFKLNKREYIESLQTSIYLCKALGQDNLKVTIINNCKNIFNIQL